MRGWRTRITSATTPRRSQRKCSRKSLCSSTSTSTSKRGRIGGGSSLLDRGELFARALGTLRLFQLCGREQGERHPTRRVGNGGFARYPGCAESALQQHTQR